MRLEEEDDEDGDDVEMPPGGLTPVRSGSARKGLDGGTHAGSSPAAVGRGPAPAAPLPVPDYASTASPPSRVPDLGEDIAYQAHIFRCVQSKTRRSIEKTYGGAPSGWRDGFVSTLRDYFVRGSATDNMSLTPEYLVMRGKSLRSSMLVVARWREGRDEAAAARAGGGDREGGRPDGEDHWAGGFCVECGRGVEVDDDLAGKGGRSWRDGLSLFLNIFACFLYMMNYVRLLSIFAWLENESRGPTWPSSFGLASPSFFCYDNTASHPPLLFLRLHAHSTSSGRPAPGTPPPSASPTPCPASSSAPCPGRP